MAKKKFNWAACSFFEPDEPDRDESFFVMYGSMRMKLWPKSDKYRIISHDLNCFNVNGLEAFHNGEWVELMEYDNGYDDYGKLHEGRWRPMRELCSWSEKGIRKLKNTLEGKKQPVTIIE